jgi:2-dehydropantoate 2-reductase
MDGGPMGRFIAHCLRDIPNPPPVTLIVPSEAHLESWKNSPKTIRLSVQNVEVEKGGIEVEKSRPTYRRHGKIITQEEWTEPIYKPHYDAATPGELLETEYTELGQNSREPIHNLVLTIRSAQTISALYSVRHRLTSNSTILFMQDSMGIVEEVSKQIFPDKTKRPHYLLGLCSHRVSEKREDPDKFFTIYSGEGTLTLTRLPRSAASFLDSTAWKTSEPWAPSSRYLLRTLLRVPMLIATEASPTDFHLAQLERLAVHSIIHPLTALIDGTNSALLYNFALTRVMRLLLAETSLILRSLPEIKMHPNVADRFSAERLETLVVAYCERTRKVISPMLSNTRLGKQTDINWINGYIVKRGEQLGLRCFMNYMIMQLVEGKRNMIDREHNEMLPLFVEPKKYWERQWERKISDKSDGAV